MLAEQNIANGLSLLRRLTWDRMLCNAHMKTSPGLILGGWLNSRRARPTPTRKINQQGTGRKGTRTNANRRELIWSCGLPQENQMD